MLKVQITIAGASLDVEGDVSLSEARAVIDQWWAAVSGADQRAIDALTARLAAANTSLRRSVDAATSS